MNINQSHATELAYTVIKAMAEANDWPPLMQVMLQAFEGAQGLAHRLEVCLHGGDADDATLLLGRDRRRKLENR